MIDIQEQNLSNLANKENEENIILFNYLQRAQKRKEDIKILQGNNPTNQIKIN